MELLLDHAIDDHVMTKYRSVVKTLAFNAKTKPSEEKSTENLNSLYLSMASEIISPAFHMKSQPKQVNNLTQLPYMKLLELLL